MSNDRTEKLGIIVEATDNASGKLSNVKREIAGIGNASAGSRFGGFVSSIERGASRIKSSLGGALSTFGGRLKQFGVGLAAAAGIGGLLSFTGALKTGLEKAQSWGLQIEKLQGITRDSAVSLSGLLAVTEKFGLSNERLSQIAGFTEKALGAIAIKAKAATKFQAAYGFSVTDASGRVKSFSNLLLTFSDYWKSGAETPAIKAAAAAKLFGRGYADLVPILNLGKKGIQDAEAEAAKLGLTLTQDNVVALAKAREATRKWGDAVGGLELQIGLTLLPTLSDLATAATNFVSGHRGDIIAFFKNAIAFAKTAASAIGTFAGQVASVWNSIPAPMRDFLVKGLVADRTIKFLFGISPIQVVAKLATDAIGSVGSTVAKGLTQSLLGGVQKVWVVNPGFGGGGGIPGVPAAAAGAGEAGLGAIIGTSITAITAGAGLGLIMGAAGEWILANDPEHGSNLAARRAAAAARGINPANVPLETGGGLPSDRFPLAAFMAAQAAGRGVSPDERQALEIASSTEQHTGKTADDIALVVSGISRLDQHLSTRAHENVAAIISGIQARSAAKYGGHGLGKSAVEATFGRDMVRLGEKITSSGQTQAQKLDQLRAIEGDLRARGDVTAQRKIDALIAAVRAIRLAVSITVPVTVKGGYTRTVTTKSGTTLVRIGGNGAAGAAAGA